MSQFINLQKPLFDYTDLELKAIAFDESQLQKMHERNINLILNELERRKMSTVVANVTPDQFNNIVR